MLNNERAVVQDIQYTLHDTVRVSILYIYFIICPSECHVSLHACRCSFGSRVCMVRECVNSLVAPRRRVMMDLGQQIEAIVGLSAGTGTGTGKGRLVSGESRT